MQSTGQVVAITGASGGIGAAAGRLLAARGDRVVLAARREEELRRVAVEIAAAGGEASTCVVDVTRREDLVSLVEHVTARFGRLDALVANAGIATTGPLVGGDPVAWDAMIDVNLRGVLNGIAAALPVFASQGHGHFVTVTSTSAIKWVPGQGVYAATKAGVRALCEVLRQEVGPEIRATMVCPGATATSSPPIRSCARRWPRSRWNQGLSRRRSRGRSPSRPRSTSARSSCARPSNRRARAAALASQSECAVPDGLGYGRERADPAQAGSASAALRARSQSPLFA